MEKTLEVYVGTIGSFRELIVRHYPPPRRIKPGIWDDQERDLFRSLRACYKVNKKECPQSFVDAIRNSDVPTVAAEIEKMLQSDMIMSNKLRGRCMRWAKRRSA